MASAFVVAMAVLLGLFGTYVVTSLLLFKFPNLVHRKKKLAFRCTHISHRGGAGENLENTMTAFKHAVEEGTDMLEIDVHLTSDGHVVVSHDDLLQRTTGLPVRISETSFASLPLLSCGIPVDFDGGKLFLLPEALQGEGQGEEHRRIPLLKDVFQQFPDLPINIDIKTNNDTLIQKVGDLIREFKREDYTVWGNFSEQVTKKCFNQNPRIPTLFSSQGVIKLILLAYSGLLPFFPLRERCLEMFMPATLLSKELDVVKNRPALRFVIWMIEKLLMRKVIFTHLRKRGIQTYLWVLNTEQDYEKAFRLGATGVMTDYPNRLHRFLQKNPHYRTRPI